MRSFARLLWRRDGRELFYWRDKKVMAVSLQFSPDLVIGKPHVLFEGDFDADFDVSADGHRFIMVKGEKAPPPSQINVVVGAFDNPKP